MVQLPTIPECEWWKGAPFPPRRWQSEALPKALASLRKGENGIVHAVMGAGKSLFLAELAHIIQIGSSERIVVSAPTSKLVQQLSADIESRVGGSVGQYYTHRKTLGDKIVVACNPSLPQLAEALTASGLRCHTWFVDEAHNSECDTLRGAVDALAPQAMLGLTATPFRADDDESLSMFTGLIHSYGPGQAIKDGVVVPWKIRNWTGAEQVSIDDACIEMIADVVQAGIGPGVVDAGGMDHTSGRPMLGTVDADEFAASLCKAGVRAASVHSKMTRRQVNNTIADLEHGRLDVIVHVAMLKEGVNLPWLRWLCLRRKVASRVWFCQHVGRVLRSYPGKSHALILDPHDLFGLHSLSYAASLGDLLGGELTEDPIPDATKQLLESLQGVGGEDQQQIIAFDAKMDHGHAQPLDDLERYMRRLVGALEATGVIVRKKTIPAGRWRKREPSSGQLETVEKYAQRIGNADAPEDVKEALRWVYRNRRALKRGAVSDFLDVTFNLPRRPWPAEASTLLA